ncbi:MAG: sulfotransferase family protein [Planctomycetaceae bacterium]|nr:sulfotransferase family protein [Planctomycetaceae bacterium]
MGNTITVVSGLPRSGTSLMMQMLDAGGMDAMTDGHRTADDDNPRGYYELENVKRLRADNSWVADAQGKVIKVIHLLLRELPENYEYRVVFMRRYIEEVLSSQMKMLERQGTKGADLTAEKLGAIFQKQLQDVDAWLADRPQFKVFDVKYHELIADPQPIAEAVNTFLGGELNTQAMVEKVDPALYRQRKSGS